MKNQELSPQNLDGHTQPWKVVLLILFFPISVLYMLWKSDVSDGLKIGVTGVFILLLLNHLSFEILNEKSNTTSFSSILKKDITSQISNEPSGILLDGAILKTVQLVHIDSINNEYQIDVSIRVMMDRDGETYQYWNDVSYWKNGRNPRFKSMGEWRMKEI